MNQYEVPALLADELPEIGKEMGWMSTLGNINKVIQVLSAYTNEMILQHKICEVSHCMNLAATLYARGNRLVKAAIENVFVYSFSIMQSSCQRKEWQRIRLLIPASLYAVYIDQACKSGCWYC